MFVVERSSASAEIREQGEINGVVDHLISDGYRAALRSMVEAAGKVATLGGHGIGVEALINRERRFRLGAPQTDSPVGDLLFKVGSEIAERCYLVQPFRNKVFIFEIRHHALPSGLINFCAEVERAIRARLDGRRVRGMNFAWQPVKGPSRRFVASPSRLPEAELTSQKPSYSAEELRAARLLVGAEARTLLLQLAQIGKVRAADAKLQAPLIEQLLCEHLLSKEYLVLCRKDSRTLCQVANIDDLNAMTGGRLVCATCGRKFSEEIIQEIFAGTELSKRLITSSRWMMIWLTDLLVGAGLSKDAVGWSATSGDDEIDIITDELGLRIIFELKDREFGLGDAYPFSYRLERYKGDLGVVVSTDRIAEEAGKFFQEQRSKAAASIETLVGTQIETDLRALIDKHSRIGVLRTLANLTEPLGIDVNQLVNNWMVMFATALRMGRYTPPDSAQLCPEGAVAATSGQT
jgi:hypothetical protein